MSRVETAKPSELALALDIKSVGVSLIWQKPKIEAVRGLSGRIQLDSLIGGKVQQTEITGR